MSDTDHSAAGDDADLTAAEYALGVLTAEERRAAETRMALEPAFARQVAGWEEQLAGMASYVRPVSPPARSWQRIEAMMSAPPQTRARPRTLWHSLGFWRFLGIGSSVLAAACIAALIFAGIRPPVPPEQPQQQRTPLLATLGGTNTGQPNFVAAIGSDGTTLMIVPAALLTADKRSMELWLIPQGGDPHSLGLIAPGAPVRISVPPDLIKYVGTGATLAVSLEPPGGSPTGKPTGPVIAHGDLTSL